MNAAVLESPRTIIAAGFPASEIYSPDLVLIQEEAVGRCGFEMHAFASTQPYRNAPVVLGHELSGVIVEKGAGKIITCRGCT